MIIFLKYSHLLCDYGKHEKKNQENQQVQHNQYQKYQQHQKKQHNQKQHQQQQQPHHEHFCKSKSEWISSVKNVFLIYLIYSFGIGLIDVADAAIEDDSKFAIVLFNYQHIYWYECMLNLVLCLNCI